MPTDEEIDAIIEKLEASTEMVAQRMRRLLAENQQLRQALGLMPGERVAGEPRRCVHCGRMSATRETRDNPDSPRGRELCWASVCLPSWAQDECIRLAKREPAPIVPPSPAATSDGAFLPALRKAP